MRMMTLSLLMLAAIGCSDQETPPVEPIPAATTSAPEAAAAPEMQTFELENRSYAIPASYVTAIRIGGENSFVRIKLPDFPGEIVVDEKSSGQTDSTGAPQIFSINDRDYPGLVYDTRDGGKALICRTGMAAQSGCGTLFEYAGTQWTLLIPLAERDRADELVEQAKEDLDRYSRTANGPEETGE